MKAAANPAVPTAGKPGLPAILTLPQLAIALQPTASQERRDPRLLLSVDPLALLRCLALAHAPVHAPSAPLLDVRSVTEWLGPHAVLLAFASGSGSVPEPRPVLALWRNAVATAVAARHLAVVRGGADPEEAWLAGLLHDLCGWWALLHGASTPYDEQRTGLEARLAHVPDSLVTRLLGGDLRATSQARPKASEDVLHFEAQALAHSAGFRHPHAKGAALRGHDAQTVKLVRSEVRRLLTELGIDSKSAVVKGKPMASERDLAGAIQALAHGRDGKTGESMRAAVLSAAVHSFDFDRAFWFTTERTAARNWLRSKLDLVPSAMHPILVTNAERDRVAIASALAGRPTVVRDAGSPLLRAIGSEECVVVALNRAFQLPSLLVLDRATSGRAIEDVQDTSAAQALASLGDLLCDNQFVRRRHARAVKFSLTDPLTHVYNRGVGIASLEKEIAKARRTNSPLTVLMIDLDYFKRLNDQNGHVVGDLALRRTADVLRRTVRRGDVLCRYGGEEFLAVLPGTALEDASITATRLFTAVQQEGERLCLPLTISIGCAQMRHEAEESAESLLTRADHALYASKAMGRNRFSVDG